jgi:iron(II)-dependent oxidoreductase
VSQSTVEIPVSIASMFTDAVQWWGKRPAPAGERELRMPDVSQAPPDTRRLIRNRQYCHLLTVRAQQHFDSLSIECARKMLEHEMAFVPGGQVRLRHDVAVHDGYGLELISHPGEPLGVDAFYLDRDCVTNADYAKFVKAGGYENPRYWPEEILSHVLQFTDRSDFPGPKFWTQGMPPRDQGDHPVVGVCWYEANAYATWVGKRLPSSEEWQRAGTWPLPSGTSGTELRYPWGNAFDPHKANTWACGAGHTFPVDACRDGDTPNGVRQLCGNVWEWIDAQYQPFCQDGISVLLSEPMAEIRGGAFDTYFATQATCQFRTGQPLLFRGNNVGFRCCLSESIVAEAGESHATQADFDDHPGPNVDPSGVER